MRVSIVVPAYNEEKRINKMLSAYSCFFNDLADNKFDYEIIVVINNTKDKTEEIVRGFSKKNKKIRFLNFKKGGKGFAVKEGFKDALKRDNDFIGFVDADMATPPESFYILVKNIGDLDGAIASRYLPGSEVFPAYTFRRKVVARAFNLLVRILFAIHLTDTQCGAKLFSRRASKIVVDEVRMSGWAFDVELLYVLKKGGLRFRDFPTRWTDVDGGSLKVMKVSMQMLLALVQLRIIKSPFRSFLRPLKPFLGILWRVIK